MWWGERVVAVVVPTSVGATTAGELEEHCRGPIAGYQVPTRIHLVDELPLAARGKVQKAVLRDGLVP